MAYIELSYTHSFNSNDLLEDLDCSFIHACSMTLYCIMILSFDYAELLLPLQHHFANFMHICLYSL